MKRLLLVLSLIWGFSMISYGQLVRSSSISVTKKVKEEVPKEKVPKEKKKWEYVPVKTGFRQYVEYEPFAVEYLLGYYPDYTTQITYTAGYRFNEHFFLGGGAGLFVNGDGYFFSRFDKSSPHCYHYTSYDSPDTSYDSPAGLPLRMMSFPLFVNARAYILKTNIQPYASLNIGGLLSGNVTAIHDDEDDLNDKTLEYNCSRFFVNPAIGVSFRLKSIDIHTAFSWRMSLNPICWNRQVDHALANSICLVVGISF